MFKTDENKGRINMIRKLVKVRIETGKKRHGTNHSENHIDL